jgi:hypothetical protein
MMLRETATIPVLLVTAKAPRLQVTTLLPAMAVHQETQKVVKRAIDHVVDDDDDDAVPSRTVRAVLPVAAMLALAEVILEVAVAAEAVVVVAMVADVAVMAADVAGNPPGIVVVVVAVVRIAADGAVDRSSSAVKSLKVRSKAFWKCIRRDMVFCGTPGRTMRLKMPTHLSQVPSLKNTVFAKE